MNRSRIRGIQALVAGIPCLGANAALPTLLSEFGEVISVRKIRRATRRRLLEVLHSTRALDSSMQTFVFHYGCLPKGKNGRPPVPPNSLGGYLYALKEHSVPGLSQMSEIDRRHFQDKIVKVRNAYMHKAGEFPAADTEIQSLLSEMHACLWLVSRL